ncbi:hypothetical protein BGZ96_008999, partial [Linnemannia gamsii]
DCTYPKQLEDDLSDNLESKDPGTGSNKMTFKISSLILLSIATFMVVLSSSAGTTIDAALPAWCVCGNNADKTRRACQSVGANWDGGSCGITTDTQNNSFWAACRLLAQQPRCWN